MQRFTNLLLCMVITFGIQLFGTAAQECASRKNYRVHTQEEINAITQDCTTIVGELGLVDWSGPLTLSNVTHIRSITVYSGDITSVELLDLEYLGSDLRLRRLPSLSKVSLPKLEYIEGLYVDLVGDAPDLYLPKLTNTSSIFLRGNFSNQSFESLQNVEKMLDICNAVNCGFFSRMETFTSMTLSFPVLERVGSLKVGGNVSRISAPEISKIGCSTCDWTVLHLKLYGSSPVAVDFPKLSTMDGNFNIRGDLDSISLPALRQYPHGLTVVPYEPLDIYLPVEKAGSFLFSGNVSSIQLPNLTDFTRIHIDSDVKFDCNGFWNDLNKSSGPLNETNFEEFFQCSKGASHSRGVQVLVALAIALIPTMAGFLV
ncbi:hypothetical protein BDW62DRAFT_191691 [Aspergillus aurantiobrunneus]